MRFLVLLLLSSCAMAPLDTLYDNPSRVSIDLLEEPAVEENGFTILVAFRRPDGSTAPVTIQDVDLHLGWVGVEAHKAPMWIADFHSHYQTQAPYYPHKRNMFVRPGEVENVDWAWWPKSVAMISGWPGADEDGKYRFNKYYFMFWEQFPDAAITLESPEQGTHWGLEWYPRTADSPPTLVFFILDEPEFTRIFYGKHSTEVVE